MYLYGTCNKLNLETVKLLFVKPGNSRTPTVCRQLYITLTKLAILGIAPLSKMTGTSLGMMFLF